MERALSVDHLTPIISEIESFKEVRNALARVCDRLDSLKSSLWSSEEISCFSIHQKNVLQYSRIHGRCLPLKSESLQERHWNLILAAVEMPMDYTLVPVGDVWNNEAFHTKEKSIEEVILFYRLKARCTLKTFLI